MSMQGNESSSSFLNYCQLKNIEELIIHNASPTISHSTFSWIQKHVISGQSAPIYTYNYMGDHCNNFSAYDSANPYFAYNFLTNPGFQIIGLSDYASARFEYNTFYHFWCGAAHWGDSVKSAL